jgi:hypothetical protein
MRGVEAACPACGGPVRFKISNSLVSVCTFCKSVIARGDRKLEDRGKVGDLVETASPLQLGLRGKYKGKSFELVGRTQYKHAAGGTWDEWYAAFPGGRWGWLAEAQGQFYLSFEKKPAEGATLPSLADLTPGASISLQGGSALTIAETGRAQMLSAEGFPFRSSRARATTMPICMAQRANLRRLTTATPNRVCLPATS